MSPLLPDVLLGLPRTRVVVQGLLPLESGLLRSGYATDELGDSQ